MIRFLSAIILLCLVFSGSLAQPIFRIDSLPRQGILLDKGWKWHAGDNPAWANPNFDDSKWEGIDPTKDIFELPQMEKTGQIAWFRIRLSLNFALHQQIAMQLNQSGASEIYLNGQSIHQFGVINPNPAKTEAFTPNGSLLSFPRSASPVQVLAVRYALQPNIRYGQHFGTQNPALSIRLNTVEQSAAVVSQQMLVERNSNLIVGVFGILTILFLAFFLFFPARKESLYFAIYALGQAISWSIFIRLYLLTPVGELFLRNNVFLIIQTISYLFLLQSVYTTLAHKRGWIFWGLMLLGMMAIGCGIYVYGWGWYVFAIGVTTFVNLDATRVALVGVRKNQKGAWIIVVGGCVYLVCWLFFQLIDLSTYLPPDLRANFFVVSYLSIPVSFAIFFGYDFGLTNRILVQKLTEVETLSAEKEQILSIQNGTLEKQVQERTAELNHSLTDLKATQTQLIQREKMASLGELTAGIAHEIQNPLNFVNNFSEVSVELVSELEDEQQKPDRDVELEADLLGDLKQNLQKITLHGNRASSIVRGMLEHSRTSTGQRQPTDLNALADEYLRLAYQGLRAKDKAFNAELKTDFDPHLGLIEVVPQDMGRVLLNLFNNAFYAVSEKKKQQPNPAYSPTVSISTRRSESGVEIRVTDNGVGMPDSVKQKIFQPFFTTKPTGEGTGLGLSLSYDIVTKGHGGEMTMESETGKSTTFLIRLPM